MIDRRNRIMISVAGVLFVVAGLVFRYFSATERPSERELVESVADKAYWVHCNACNESFEMPAAEYIRAMNSRRSSATDGITCSRCGAPKAWRVRVAADHGAPALDPGIESLQTVAEVEGAMHDVNRDLARNEKKLAEEKATTNSGQAEQLRTEQRLLRARLDQLNDKWDQITSRQN